MITVEKTREQKLVEAVRFAIDAIEIYPDRKHPMTASEVMLRQALKKYRDNE